MTSSGGATTGGRSREGEAQQGNGLPENGLVGRLTGEQYRALKAFWRELFRLVDAAPEQGSLASTDHSDSSHSHSHSDDSLLLSHKDSPSSPPSKLSPSPEPSPALKDDHLKEKLRAQQELSDAKNALQKYGRTRFMDTFWNMIMMDDPDVIVLKFLRARKWNVSAGVAMMAACMKWRMEFGVDRIIEKGEEGFLDQEGFLHQLKIGKTFVQGTDRQGRPVVYINVRLHKASDQAPKTLEEFIVFSMESVRLMLTPPLVEKVTIIIDMTGFGLANMDWKSLAFIVKCLESYYPESLNVLVVHNPPWVFQGLWKIIAPMLDPVVRAKIQISKTSEELQEHIDPAQLLSNLGGKNGWKWTYEPVEKGENEMMGCVVEKKHELQNRQKLIKAYQDLTRIWAAAVESSSEQQSGGSEENPINSLAILPEDPSPHARLRTFVMYHLRVHYFILDPYIRGRSVYHRQGRVMGNGLVTFIYPQVIPAHLPPSSSSHPTQLQQHDSDKDGQAHNRVDYWQVLGHHMARESLLINIENMKDKFRIDNIQFPVF